jgi:hypothetical protein
MAGPVMVLGAFAYRCWGENTYRVHVPPNVPMSEFWALTVYGQKTAALFRDTTRLTLGSLDKGVRKNADGSVDHDG